MKSPKLKSKPEFAAQEAGADPLDMSDVWLTPAKGRVVFDARGNSVWQWPSQEDPFSPQDAARHMDAAELRVVEPSEIHRSEWPWLHETERPARDVEPRYVAPSFGPRGNARARRMR